MATTNYPVNHPLAVKVWSKKIAREALKSTQAFKFMSTGKNSLCMVLDDLQKGAGDRVRVPLRMIPTGRGVGEGQALEGNEEALVTYYDDCLINEVRHAVAVDTIIDAQRVPFEAREEAKDGIVDWYKERIDTMFFNQLAGNTGQADLLYTGNNAAVAPSSASTNTRIIYPTAHTTENSISASGTYAFDLSFIDRAVQLAKEATPVIPPVRIGGDSYYVAFLHPSQVRAMRTTTSTGQFLDIQKAAMAGGDVENNPIFTGALGVHNGVVLHESVRVPLAPSTTLVRRGIFCGAQAIALCFGKGYGEEPKYIERDFDFGKKFGAAVETIVGMKKTQFNSVDYATIVMSTYAAAAG